MSVPEKLTCPACGEPILLTDNQCLGCGAHLDEGRLVGAPTGEAAPPPKASAPAAPSDVLEVDLSPETPPARPGVESATAPPPSGQSAVPYHVTPGAQAWGANSIPRGAGVGTGLKRAWIFLLESLNLAEGNLIVLVPSLLSTVCGIVLVGAMVWIMSVVDRGITHGSRAHTPGLDLVWVVGGFMIVLAGFWFMGMTVDLVSAVLRRQPATLAHAWDEACSNGLALVWLALITTVVNALTSQSRRNAVVNVMAESIETGWRAASYLLIPIVILEDIPLSKAFERAVQLHKNNVIAIIVGEIGISWLSGAIGGIVMVGLIVGGFFAYQAAPLVLPVYIVSGAGLFIVLASALAYVHMAYYTCLYEWAAAEEKAGEAVAAPAPLEAALGLA